METTVAFSEIETAFDLSQAFRTDHPAKKNVAPVLEQLGNEKVQKLISTAYGLSIVCGGCKDSEIQAILTVLGTEKLQALFQEKNSLYNFLTAQHGVGQRANVIPLLKLLDSNEVKIPNAIITDDLVDFINGPFKQVATRTTRELLDLVSFFYNKDPALISQKVIFATLSAIPYQYTDLPAARLTKPGLEGHIAVWQALQNIQREEWDRLLPAITENANLIADKEVVGELLKKLKTAGLDSEKAARISAAYKQLLTTFLAQQPEQQNDPRAIALAALATRLQDMPHNQNPVAHNRMLHNLTVKIMPYLMTEQPQVAEQPAAPAPSRTVNRP